MGQGYPTTEFASATHEIWCTYQPIYADEFTYLLFDIRLDLLPFKARMEQDFWCEKLMGLVKNRLEMATSSKQLLHYPGSDHAYDWGVWIDAQLGFLIQQYEGARS